MKLKTKKSEIVYTILNIYGLYNGVISFRSNHPEESGEKTFRVPHV